MFSWNQILSPLVQQAKTHANDDTLKQLTLSIVEVPDDDKYSIYNIINQNLCYVKQNKF